MNYTITFNPAVDLVIQVDQLNLGDLNRSKSENYVAGGKGINMAVILNRLDQPAVTTGFLGGFTGKFIEEAMTNEGVTPHFISVDGTTRINVKLKSETETEINAGGPTVTADQFKDLLDYLDQEVTDQDTVFLAGNSAPGLDETHYQAIAKLCQAKQAKFVLDTNKDLLTACLPYQPFLIKPNHHELGEIFGVTLTDTEEIITYVKKLQEQGARNVIVSRGGDGSLLVTEEGAVYTANVPNGQVVNSVGAGDSMVAGFMAKFNETGDYPKSLQQGAATGSATAYSVGIATREDIDALVDQITVKQYEK